MYNELSKHYNRTSYATHYDNFRCEGKQLYFKGRDEPLTNEDRRLRKFSKLKSIPGQNRIRNLGFDVPKGATVQVLNKAKEELHSMSDIAKADDIELQEIMENASRSMENLNQQLEGEDLPVRELLGLDKQLRSIRGSLKVEVAKKVQLEESIKKEKRKLWEFRDYPGVYDDGIREDIMKWFAKLNDELKVRQESISFLKGRLTNQITSFKDSIAKVLDKDTSFATKIRTLFREQGITIASILMAIRMAIRELVEALLPGGGGAASPPPPPKDEKSVKEWLRNKLKALASLLGILGVKAAESLPGIIGAIIS